MIKGLIQKFRKPERRTQAQRMLTLRSAPVYYLPITKSGSTYLKNLFYYLDHAEEHAAGHDIHSKAKDLLRATSGDEEAIRQSPYAFSVLRDPVDRFISLYFDKIYGDGPRNFPDVRAYLATEIGLNLTPDLNVLEHRQNCYLLIDWLALNLAFKTDQPVNHHWRRQSSRLQRVKALDVAHLTLEGLNWQLPLFLGEVLPNIEEAMAAVSADNRTEKPYSRADIVDAELLGKIEATYAHDKTLCDQAVDRWQPWLGYHPVVTGDEKIRCLSTAGQPLNCVVTPKVGCTYLRNLLYLMENGEAYHDPLRIHVEGSSLATSLTKQELAEQVSFFVVRNPTDRFVSLYFDKIYGSGDRSFHWVTNRLVRRRGFVQGPDLTIEQHQQNCMALLGYIARKLRIEEPADQNPHWSAQVETVKKAIRFDMKPLLLEDLDNQLIQIAGGRIEGLEDAMRAVPNRNTSPKLFSTAELVTPEIAERISALYGDDQALYERVKLGWRTTGQPPKL